jgi:hypothetical protein
VVIAPLLNSSGSGGLSTRAFRTLRLDLLILFVVATKIKVLRPLHVTNVSLAAVLGWIQESQDGKYGLLRSPGM